MLDCEGDSEMRAFYLCSGIDDCRRLKSALNISEDLVEIREPLQRSNLSQVMAACDVGPVPFEGKSLLFYVMSIRVYKYLGADLYVMARAISELSPNDLKWLVFETKSI